MTQHIKLDAADKSGVVNVTYKGGKFGPHAVNTPQYYITLDKPNDEATLEYEVFFEKGFDFNRGGKIHGLASAKAISGGNKSVADFSVRLMWRSGGNGEAYLYVPPELQTSEYKKSCTEQNASYGDSLGRGKFKFVPNAWNKIKVYVKLNDVGKHNGIVRVFHNGKEAIECDCVTFRNNKSTQIRVFMFSTFFGGSTQDWAPKDGQDAKFRNFVVTTK